MPEVKNPVLQEENFNRHWGDAQYKNFCEKFSSYCEKINDAYEEEDHNESVKKWRKLFGEQFGELRDNNQSFAAGLGAAAASSGAIAAVKPYGGKCD